MPENKPSCAPPLPACPAPVEVEVDGAVRMAMNIRQMGHRILSSNFVGRCRHVLYFHPPE
jgi:hypothetical protein